MAVPLSRSFEAALLRSAVLWVAALVLANVILPPGPLLLRVCALFSLSMNVPYSSAAVHTGRGVASEMAAAGVMSLLALYALATASLPALVASVVLHGVWDMAKHGLACGVPFFSWYLSSCLLFDLAWAFYMYLFL